MVEAPSQQQRHDDPRQASTPSTARAEPTPAPLHPMPRRIQTKTIETQAILHTVQPVQQVVTQEVVHTRPLAQTATEVIHHPTVETPQTISRTAQAIETPTPDLPVQTASAPVNHATPIERDTAVLSTPHEVTKLTKQMMTEPTPVNSSESTVVSHSNVEATQTSPTVQERVVNETAPTIAESTAIVEGPDMVEPPAAAPSSVRELPVRSTPSVHTSPNRTESFIEQAKIPGPPAAEFSQTKELSAQRRPAVKADFGWLARVLLSRIEQLKRYPQTARLNHWEGKVVLRAVIREDGQLIGVEVAESSGHSVLDDDALDIIRKASPLELAHPLGQSQVIVRVPIRYRLEQ